VYYPLPTAFENCSSKKILMSNKCIERPELKAPVLNLIGKVSKSHTKGAFTMPLADVFAAFGLTLDEGEWSKLRARGNVSFAPQGKAAGHFSNEGERQEIETGEGLTLVVPSELAGEYKTAPDALTLAFAEGRALRGCKRVFVLICEDVVKVEASEHRLLIDLPGDKYDLCFEF
jgi:hypothetical protein